MDCTTVNQLFTIDYEQLQIAFAIGFGLPITAWLVSRVLSDLIEIFNKV